MDGYIIQGDSRSVTDWGVVGQNGLHKTFWAGGVATAGRVTPPQPLGQFHVVCM